MSTSATPVREHGIPRGLDLMKAWYERARLWVVYAAVLLVIAVLYLGGLLGPARAFLMPAALGILTMFAIQSLQTIERQTGPRTADLEFAHVQAAIPALCAEVCDDREVTDVKVIAATGWTTVREVLPPLLAASRATVVNVSMQVVQPDGPLAAVYPCHWPDEVRRVVTQVAEDWGADPRVHVSIDTMTYVPPVHGLLVDDRTLLVGFFGWTAAGSRPELTGAQRPHTLHRRGDPTSEHLFALFHEWFHHAPHTPLLRRKERGRPRVPARAAAG